jgi:GTP-binding protein HflX
VVDVTHPEFEDHIQIVKNTLTEIGVIDKPTILVLNKIDAFPEKEDETFADFENNWISKEQWPVVFVSAANKTNIEALKNLILSITIKNHDLKSRF